MKKSDNFLYQLNINCKKYPDICKVLEEEKENNGIAFYLRNLIKQDIERRNSDLSPIQNMNKNTTVIHSAETNDSSKIESEIIDESGGFV